MISESKLPKSIFIKIFTFLVFIVSGGVPLSKASTWCDFSNFDVVVAEDRFSAVFGTSLDADGKYVYLGDLETEKGRAIHSLLLAAAIAGKTVKYGDNDQNYACGALPIHSTATVNPQYLRLITRE